MSVSRPTNAASIQTALLDIVESVAGLELAVLYGSAATGVLRPDSDLDVGVLLEPSTSADLAALTRAIASATGRTVDLVDLADAPPLLRFEVARSGRVLTERRPWAWADFRARAMCDWWDWAPTARMLHRAAKERLEDRIGPR